MHLIQLLLPVYDNNKQPFGAQAFDRVRNELTETFGGVTAFRRAPAEGAWKEDSGAVNYDEVVIFEVMSESLERDWWRTYRAALERRFRQDELLIRASEVERL